MALILCGESEIDGKTEILFYFSIICILLSHIGISWIFWTRRKNFPLKERSPNLTINLIIYYMFFLLIYPLVILYRHHQTSDYDSSDFYYRILKFIYFFLRGGTTCIFVVRSLRIWYAWNQTFRHHALDGLFGSERWLILISNCITIIGSLPALLLWDTYITPYESVELHENYDPVTYFYWMMHTFGEQLLYAVLVYVLRNIPVSYSIGTELILVAFLQFLNDLIYNVLFFGKYTYDSCLDQSLPAALILADLRIIIMLIFSVAYPLYISIKVRIPLTPRLVLQDLDTFLGEKMCMNAFHLFLERLYKSLNSKYGEKSKHFLIYFSFWIEVRLHLNELKYLRPYFTDNFSKEIFPVALIQNITKAIDTYQSDREKFSIYLFEAYKLAQENLESLYKNDFLKTKSFKIITHRLERYEAINERLFGLGMTEINLNRNESFDDE